jgi:hypothetical protein
MAVNLKRDFKIYEKGLDICTEAHYIASKTNHKMELELAKWCNQLASKLIGGPIVKCRNRCRICWAAQKPSYLLTSTTNLKLLEVTIPKCSWLTTNVTIKRRRELIQWSHNEKVQQTNVVVLNVQHLVKLGAALHLRQAWDAAEAGTLSPPRQF